MTAPDSQQPLQCPFNLSKYRHVTEPALVQEVLRDEKRYAPSNALQSHHKIHPRALRELHKAGFSLPPVLANQSGDQHRKVRQKLATLFTKKQVRTWQPRYVEIVRTALGNAKNQLASHHTADLAKSVTGTPPTQLILEIFGWPTDRVWDLKGWSDAGLELFWGEPDTERQVDLARACAQLYRWLQDSAITGTDRYSQTLEGTGLNRKEMLSLAFFLSIAGHQTTTYLANTALTQALSSTWPDTGPPRTSAPSHPHVALSDEVAEWALAQTRHTLRSVSSVPTWRRVVTEDSNLGTENLHTGEELLLHLTGHHPEVATDQDFQLAFGLGPHRCLGAELAVMEVSTILAETAHALPGLQLDKSSTESIELLSFQAPVQVWCSLASSATTEHTK